MKQVFRRVIDRRGSVVVVELPEPHVGPDQVLVQSRYSLISSGTEMSTLAKTPVELAKQTLSDPVDAQRRQADGALGRHDAVGAPDLARDDHAPRDRVQRRGHRGGATATTSRASRSARPSPTRRPATPSSPRRRSTTSSRFPTTSTSATPRSSPSAASRSRRCGVRICSSVRSWRSTGSASSASWPRGSRSRRAASSSASTSTRAPTRSLEDAGASFVVEPAAIPDWKRQILDFTGKHGVDATIICASSDSSEIVNASMEITRRQGRVVIVGYVKLDIHPKHFLYREIDLRYSRAYGPGSYHTGYEKGRLDYPFGYVRWTEKRNLAEVIRLISVGAISLEPLIGGVYDLDDVQSAFDAVQQGTLGGLAALIRYRDEEPERKPDAARSTPGRARTAPSASH